MPFMAGKQVVIEAELLRDNEDKTDKKEAHRKSSFVKRSFAKCGLMIGFCKVLRSRVIR